MKEYELYKYLQSFGVDKNFFDISRRTDIGYMGGELGFKSKNSGLLSKFKKQFIPMSEVFPKNRKRILIALHPFDAHESINYYGVGSPAQVKKNYDKAIEVVTAAIHKKIQKRVSKGEDYDSAFYDEEELFDTEKIFEKHKIFSVHDNVDLPEDLDYMYHTPKEREEYDFHEEFMNKIFMDDNEAHFFHPYKEDDKRRLAFDFFVIKYKKYSFLVPFTAFTNVNMESIHITI